MAKSDFIQRAETPALRKRVSPLLSVLIFLAMVALQLAFGLLNHKLSAQMAQLHSIYWTRTFPFTTACDLVFVVLLRYMQNLAVDKHNRIVSSGHQS